MPSQRYGNDVLAAAAARRRPRSAPEVPATPGRHVRHRASGFAGHIVEVETGRVTLRDGRGTRRVFLLQREAFVVDSTTVTLIQPSAPATGSRAPVTASGSVRGPSRPARTARASRVWVEGLHDAELVEKVWGDDLRDIGVVVEPLGGLDHLHEAVQEFQPGPRRRLGVLVDHLVHGSKEHRIAETITSPHVLVAGHPYIDVWQGVRPRALGMAAWPVIPPGQPWKEGVCAALAAADPPTFWRRLLGSVHSYADLEQPLVGAVEQLIDFVTAPA